MPKHNTPILFHSFVYRQDGYELSSKDYNTIYLIMQEKKALKND